MPGISPETSLKFLKSLYFFVSILLLGLLENEKKLEKKDIRA